jgi:hypothetical protein
MFTDLIGIAKGDVLDGQKGEELVDEVEVEEDLESEEELDSETGADADGASGANEGAADSAPSGAQERGAADSASEPRICGLRTEHMTRTKTSTSRASRSMRKW